MRDMELKLLTALENAIPEPSEETTPNVVLDNTREVKSKKGGTKK